MYRHYLTMHSKNQVFDDDNLKSLPLIFGLNEISVANVEKNSKNCSQQTLMRQSTLSNVPYSPIMHSSVHSKSYNDSLNNLQPDLKTDFIPSRPEKMTQIKQYQLREQLGQGSYGLVRLAYSQENSTYYAMKIISKKKLMKSCGLFNRPMPLRKTMSTDSSLELKGSEEAIDPLQKTYKEIAIHKKIRHPNIVTLIEIRDDLSEPFLYLVFEFVENGPVMIIGKDDPFPEKRARKYFIDALLGLEYLHYQKIVHRDIKPANLLLSKQDRIKIADFGVSNEFTGDDVYLTSTVGSPAFMAPESVGTCQQPFAGKALDIWALGITLYAFLFAKIPFVNCNRYLLYHMIINNPIVYPESYAISEEVILLLRKMLDKDPLTRIKIQEIKIHNWTTELGVKLLPTEMENCGSKCIDVTDDEVANSIRQVPNIETVI